MKKAYFGLFICIAVVFGGCALTGEPKPAKEEANKTIKRTNITVNNFSECPSSTPNNYKTIPYE